MRRSRIVPPQSLETWATHSEGYSGRLLTQGAEALPETANNEQPMQSGCVPVLLRTVDYTGD